LSIHDATGTEINRVTATTRRGINRVVWNLRHADIGAGGQALRGPRVAPGEFTVRLSAGGQTHEKKLTVREDPRIIITGADRKAWQFLCADSTAAPKITARREAVRAAAAA
jgi:hypothetical protein